MPQPVITIKPPYTPELLTGVQEIVKEHIGRGSRVFEYGSGYSTVWFAEMGATVTAIEDDPEWYEETTRALNEAGQKASVILCKPEQMATKIKRRVPFDLVLVDCGDDQRLPVLEMAVEYVKPGGLLLLDDSHWPALQEADSVVGDWSKQVISGQHRRHWTKNGEVRDHQTTIWTRPE